MVPRINKTIVHSLLTNEILLEEGSVVLNTMHNQVNQIKLFRSKNNDEPEGRDHFSNAIPLCIIKISNSSDSDTQLKSAMSFNNHTNLCSSKNQTQLDNLKSETA